jgi:PPOX class probable F420-dependent enzyme
VATLDEKQREFLANPFYAVASTVRDDGSVHNTVVWVDVDDEGLWFNTSIGRAKERHLRNNPNVSVMVVDPANAYRWVAVSGQAELRTESGDADIDHLSNKYLGKDYPYRQPGEVRVTVRVSSDKVEATGLDG